MGDGNCSYRALAHVLLSDEGQYQEVRARITFEAVLKEDSFLKHDILARGHLEGSKNRPAAYASYSGLLTPEITTLNEQSIRTVYHHDVIANARDFTFMGVWQLHHAAEAFRCQIISVYPRYTEKFGKILIELYCPSTLCMTTNNQFTLCGHHYREMTSIAM